MRSIEIEPLDDRVLILPHRTDEESPGGIIVPEQARRRIPRATVVAVGKGRVLNEGGRKDMSVKSGDTVMFTLHAGQEIDHKGEKYLLVDEGHILAIVRGE